MYIVNVDREKCTGDGECVTICPVSVFELQEGKAVPVNGDQCLGCRSCEAVCPSGAITITEM
ncbi:MAG: ferredoxin family protein [Thaumarchaeota archaeon]|jgi:NAD-dependent dihydropyrimidine dehydrogenase PreA subunit|nr:ferredoxin family protein [Candidatus Geocrenenecus arthurdayi]MCL7389274.1 ferredoxin family protein [Candidatus Geocrenenecus arthurdayi]MCL7391330.1 ferredoxin family protein [Candidatus Geocrenenecus arthurdayi]MCL7401223.1 ferredoxin family protein [Candidatus Geocrenenecus arthurdayi]MCL7404033.1 ferredoxin family protein [Candidatus Geocrenenecus arthurdayi]